ncbi:MAG: DUF192 domain-containing protein [Nitrospiraceae bacterium]|nr:MAG: DUF192 domain-containing protein [Nitrospiraceae bacterium]
MKTFIPFIFFIIFLSFPLTTQGGKQDTTRVCKKETLCVQATIASSPETRKHGLRYISRLPEDRGILFVLPRFGFTPIWMKDTMIPLDIVWLDNKKKVVTIKPGAQPCVQGQCKYYYPAKKSLYILELTSGLTQKWDLQIGDRLIFELP